MFYAICDCDNCYVSCERVFRPDLKNKPVVVLSNNDGCVVARSKEAKQMGIKSGLPYFQMREQFPNGEIVAFSSNYELYGELTGRVMTIISQASPKMFRYSIDESFCLLPDMSTNELHQWGVNLCQQVAKCVGMPISIGIARTKTLAKTAVHFAKKHPGYQHCCVIDNDEKRVKALQLFPIEDVWGVGRQYAARLKEQGIVTAFDFSSHAQSWIRLRYNIVLERTWMELNGDDCVPNEEMARKKSICTSRSFTRMLDNYDAIRTHVANFAAICAHKLRRQHSVATIVSVFLHTNYFREDLPQYWNSKEITLLTPSNATQTIVQTAARALDSIYVSGYQYKKAGVIVMEIVPDNAIQTNFIDYHSDKVEKRVNIDKVVDHLNKLNGEATVMLAAQQYQQKDANGKPVVFADAIQHAFKTKNPTTRWSDIIRLK